MFITPPLEWEKNLDLLDLFVQHSMVEMGLDNMGV